MSRMDIGGAVEALKNGWPVRRRGWNGKGMFLYYAPADAYPARTPIGQMIANDNGLVPYSAYVAMKTADGNVVPWLASQTDLLADDWGALTDDPQR